MEHPHHHQHQHHDSSNVNVNVNNGSNSIVPNASASVSSSSLRRCGSFHSTISVEECNASRATSSSGSVTTNVSYQYHPLLVAGLPPPPAPEEMDTKAAVATTTIQADCEWANIYASHDPNAVATALTGTVATGTTGTTGNTIADMAATTPSHTNTGTATPTNSRASNSNTATTVTTATTTSTTTATTSKAILYHPSSATVTGTVVSHHHHRRSSNARQHEDTEEKREEEDDEEPTVSAEILLQESQLEHEIQRLFEGINRLTCSSSTTADNDTTTVADNPTHPDDDDDASFTPDQIVSNNNDVNSNNNSFNESATVFSNLCSTAGSEEQTRLMRQVMEQSVQDYYGTTVVDATTTSATNNDNDNHDDDDQQQQQQQQHQYEEQRGECEEAEDDHHQADDTQSSRTPLQSTTDDVQAVVVENNINTHSDVGDDRDDGDQDEESDSSNMALHLQHAVQVRSSNNDSNDHNHSNTTTNNINHTCSHCNHHHNHNHHFISDIAISSGATVISSLTQPNYDNLPRAIPVSSAASETNGSIPVTSEISYEVIPPSSPPDSFLNGNNDDSNAAAAAASTTNSSTAQHNSIIPYRSTLRGTRMGSYQESSISTNDIVAQQQLSGSAHNEGNHSSILSSRLRQSRNFRRPLHGDATSPAITTTPILRRDRNSSAQNRTIIDRSYLMSRRGMSMRELRTNPTICNSSSSLDPSSLRNSGNTPETPLGIGGTATPTSVDSAAVTTPTTMTTTTTPTSTSTTAATTTTTTMPSTGRPTLTDRGFSRRALREIEEASSIVVDNPHLDALERRKRLSRNTSQRSMRASGSSTLLSTTPSPPPQLLPTGSMTFSTPARALSRRHSLQISPAVANIASAATTPNVVVDNPHIDAVERRKRFTRNPSQRSMRGTAAIPSVSIPPAAIPTVRSRPQTSSAARDTSTPTSTVPSSPVSMRAIPTPPEDDDILEQAKAHLSLQEIEEIRKALQEADGSISRVGSADMENTGDDSLAVIATQPSHTETYHGDDNLDASSASNNSSSFVLRNDEGNSDNGSSNNFNNNNNSTQSLTYSAGFSSDFSGANDADNARAHQQSQAAEEYLLEESRFAQQQLTSTGSPLLAPASPQVHIPETQQSTAMDGGLSQRETAEIEAALREADAAEEERSLLLAFQMQQQEVVNMRQHQQRPYHQQHTRQRQPPHVPTFRPTSRQLAQPNSQRHGAVYSADPPPQHPLESALHRPEENVSQVSGAAFSPDRPTRHPMERNRDGPAQRRPPSRESSFQREPSRSEPAVRPPSSHSIEQRPRRHSMHAVPGDASATSEARLEPQGKLPLPKAENTNNLDAPWRCGSGEYGNIPASRAKRSVSDGKNNSAKAKANPSLRKLHSSGGDSVEKQSVQVRLQLGRAIKSGLIEKCNGAVSQGKEAIVYHANTRSGQHDVAVKILKRSEGLKERLTFISDDPRYKGKLPESRREQLHLWAEKEFRNLVRATRAKVPVPTPVHYKENIVFMRFMGVDGSPSPNLNDMEIPSGDQQWDTLYTQVMEAIRRLYINARLVHADLNEHNILVTPANQVDNTIGCVEDDRSEEMQAVIIDFGRAVDLQHPEAESFLKKDLSNVCAFFQSRGVQTLHAEESLEFVMSDFDSTRDDDDDAFNNDSSRTLDLSFSQGDHEAVGGQS